MLWAEVNKELNPENVTEKLLKDENVTETSVISHQK